MRGGSRLPADLASMTSFRCFPTSSQAALHYSIGGGADSHFRDNSLSSFLVLASMYLMPTGKLQVVPLGGLGEFGMNCMAIRWGDDIIVIDAGLMFPEAELLGVDIVVPDITYLIENRAHVRAIVLTHGHEDHIGALPWILSELNVPVYGTEFTLAYVEGKLEEHALLDDAELNEIRSGVSFKVGPFTIGPIQVTHSLVDCVALAIHTPLGVIIHTGDFKVDPTPTDNR